MADDAVGAVRRTPRPTPRAGDHQTPETATPVAPGATNPATPVSPDAGTGTDDLSPEAAAIMEGFEGALAALRANLAHGPHTADLWQPTTSDLRTFLELPDYRRDPDDHFAAVRDAIDWYTNNPRQVTRG